MYAGAFIVDEHRYHLHRAWVAEGRSVCWIMLNPSTADGNVDDPTVRKCIGFTQRWGYGSLDILNLYTYRSPSPQALARAGYPVGAFADAVIHSVLREYVDMVVYAWGTRGRADRIKQVDGIVREHGFQPRALSITKDGFPAHPLYQPYSTELVMA